jgi:putative holliday junction resolvase
LIRILGLDVGTVRIGVALSDPLGMTAQPLAVIERKRENPYTAVQKLVEEHEVQRVVVGQPLQLDGKEGQAAQAVSAFVEQLRKHVTVPIELWDERMTTAAAQRMMIGGGARRDERKQNIDKVAAALILQSYLDARGASS